MRNIDSGTRSSFTLLLALFLAGTGLGCGSDDNPTPPDSGAIITPDGSTSPDGASPDTAAPGTDGGATDVAAADGSTGDAALADGGAVETGVAPDGGGNSFPGCLTGKPTDRNSAQFLNACAGGCVPFPNAQRLSRWNGGNLPALP